MQSRPDDNIRLFAFRSGWGVPFATAAPFPLKLGTWMRMAGIPFEWVIADDPRKGPKGKSPWIEYGDVRMGDSTLIIEHLGQRYGVDLDAHLTPVQRASSIAVQRMLEEHYHQCFEHQLFFGHGGPQRLQAFADTMSAPMRWVAPKVLGHMFSTQLHARGMGRHSDAVIVGQGTQDLDALAVMIGDGPFFHGETPSLVDACIFGFLGVTIYVEGDNPLFRHAASQPRLVAYCERMRERYFPESFETLPALPQAEHAQVEPPRHETVRRAPGVTAGAA